MKKILVNVDIDHVRIAITENAKVVEYIEENDRTERIVSNIYKGKVRNILPGMQSAFVDIGLEKDLFLYVGDAYSEDDYTYTYDCEEETHEELENSEDKKEKILIQDLMSKDDEIVVQIMKEPIGNKGPRGTTQLTIPGRYVVLMPTQKHVGISRKIEDEEERERLKAIGEEVCPENMGIIIRTVAVGREKQLIVDDIKFLLKLWSKLEDKIKNSSCYTVIYSDLELVLKMVRDLFSSDIDELLIDCKIEYDKIMEFFDFLPEHLLKRINYFSSNKPLFEEYEIEKQLDKLLNKNVSLKCGGYIIIEKTEALTAIDVNTGSFVGKSSDLEETVYQTNIEAAKEIARQIKLRDIGGIIIIDFIDMKEETHQQEIVEILETECKKDKMPITIGTMSQFGLVEMTRKRVRKSLLGLISAPCPYCKGKGFILSAREISSRVRREIRRFARKTLKDNILVSVHPEVAFFLIGEDEKNLSKMEYETRKKIYIRTEKNFHIEHFIIS